MTCSWVPRPGGTSLVTPPPYNDQCGGWIARLANMHIYMSLSLSLLHCRLPPICWHIFPMKLTFVQLIGTFSLTKLWHICTFMKAIEAKGTLKQYKFHLLSPWILTISWFIFPKVQTVWPSILLLPAHINEPKLSSTTYTASQSVIINPYTCTFQFRILLYIEVCLFSCSGHTKIKLFSCLCRHKNCIHFWSLIHHDNCVWSEV